MNTLTHHAEILIVDDELINLVILDKHLKRSGFMTRQAMDGIEALALIEESPPQLILLDLNMPKMDGFEVIQKLTTNGLSPQIPIIVISANITEENRRFCFENNCLAFIEKPVNFALLVDLIKESCQNRSY